MNVISRDFTELPAERSTGVIDMSMSGGWPISKLLGEPSHLCVPPHNRVPHLRRGRIAPKVGHFRGSENPDTVKSSHAVGPKAIPARRRRPLHHLQLLPARTLLHHHGLYRHLPRLPG